MNDYCPKCGEIQSACVCPHVAVIETGEAQLVMAQTPPRKVLTTGLKAKAKQNEKPTVLELYEEIITQPKLF